VLLELASVLVLVHRPAAVRQDSLQHAHQDDESVQPHGHVPRQTVSTLSSQYYRSNCSFLVSTLLLLSSMTMIFPSDFFYKIVRISLYV